MTWNGVIYIKQCKIKMLFCTQSPFLLGGNFRGAKECGRANASVGRKRSAENSIKSLVSRQWKVWSNPHTFCDRALIIWTGALFPQALELLPSSIEVREVYTFLLNVLEDKEKKRKNCQVLKSLLFAEHLQVGTIQTNFCYPLKRYRRLSLIDMSLKHTPFN